MQWYHSHKKEVLHYTHQHLVNFDVASIQRMSRSTMLEYIELLNIARIFYEKETSQLATNQSTIHSWIDKHSSIAQRVRSDPRQRNPTMIDSSHSDSTQECEFDWQPQSWIDKHGSIVQRVKSRQRSTPATMDDLNESFWESDSTDSTWGSNSTCESDSTRGSHSNWESDPYLEPLQQTNVQRDAERIIWDTGD